MSENRVIDPNILFNRFTARLYDIFGQFHAFFPGNYIIEELKGLPEGASVLDLGCGTGIVTARVARELGLNVTGVEPSRAMLNIAWERMEVFGLKDKVCLLSDRAETLPVPSSIYDAVYMTYVWHHIPSNAIDRTLEEVHRVLKVNGKFISVDLLPPVTGIGGQQIIGAWARYGPDELGKYAESFGLKHDHTYYPFFHIVLVFRKQRGRHVGKQVLSR